MNADLLRARAILKQAEDANDAPEALQFVRQATEELLCSTIRAYGKLPESASPFAMVQQLHGLRQATKQDAHRLENLVNVLSGLGNLAVHSPDYVLLTPSSRDSAVFALRLLFKELGSPIPERREEVGVLPFQSRMSAAAELCGAAALDLIERPESQAGSMVATMRAYRTVITALGILTRNLPSTAPDLDSAGAYGMLRLLRKTPLAHAAQQATQQMRAIDRAWERGEDLPGAEAVRALAYWIADVRTTLNQWTADRDEDVQRIRADLRAGLLWEPVHVEVLLVAGTPRVHGVRWNGEFCSARKRECWQQTARRLLSKRAKESSAARSELHEAFSDLLEYTEPDDVELEYAGWKRPSDATSAAFEVLALEIIHAGVLATVSNVNFRRMAAFGEHALHIGRGGGVDAGICIAAIGELLDPQRHDGAVQHIREVVRRHDDERKGQTTSWRSLWPASGGWHHPAACYRGAQGVYNMPLRLTVSRVVV